MSSNQNKDLSLNESADIERNINDSSYSDRDSTEIESNLKNSTHFRDYIENDPKYLGESSNPNLINGPLNVRNCTDKLCLLIFLIFLAVWILISLQGFSQGNPTWLSTPFDSTAHQCGYSTGYSEFPYIYFPNEDKLGQFVCVKKCPTLNSEQKLPSFLECVPIPPLYSSEIGKCQQDVDKFVIQETILEGKTCIPKNRVFRNKLGSILQPENFQEIQIKDLEQSWAIILGSFMISLTIGFLMFFVMRKFPACIIWGCLFLVDMGMFIIGYLLYYNEQYKKNGITDEIKDKYETPFKILGVFLIILSFIFIFYIILRRNRINLSIALIRTSGDFTVKIKRSIAIPIYLSFAYIILVIFWFFSLTYSFSAGQVTSSQFISGPYKAVEYSSSMRLSFPFQIAIFLWLNSLISSISQFLVASTCSLWYHDQINVGQRNYLRTSFKRIFTHLGTLAYSSSLLFLIQLINQPLKALNILTYSRRNVPISQFCNIFIKISKYYEARLQFFSELGYVQVAFVGSDFYKACYDSFYLMKRFKHHFEAVNGVGSIILLLGKYCICIIGTLIAFAMLNDIPYYQEAIQSKTLPILICLFSVYLVGGLIMSLYGTAIDAILQCYCIDEELNEKMGTVPKQTPPSLRDFMERNNIEIIKKKKSIQNNQQKK